MSAEAVRAPPYAIRTERLTIRCWEPRDALLLKEALDTSLDHLRPWMPWAVDEPKPLQQTIDLLRRFRGMFDLEQDFVYGVLHPGEAEVLGGSGLHTRAGEGALEIGYWLRASAVGRGLARETVAALAVVALRVCEVDRVEVHVDPANERSLRVPRALGFAEEARLRRRLPPGADGRPRDMVVFTLFRHELERSPLAEVAPRAYDAVGREIPL